MNTQPLKVGFDYDEPYYPWYDYAHDVSVEAGLTTMEQDPPTVWDPTTVYGCALSDWFDVINTEVLKGKDGMYGRPPKPGVVADLWRLRNRGIEIHFVTARGQFGEFGERIKRLTVEQLRDTNTPYESLTFTSDKEGAIRRLGLDYFIDDRPEYHRQAADAGAMSYLLDERWNQDYAVHASRRVYTTRQYIDRIIRAYEHQQAHNMVASLGRPL